MPPFACAQWRYSEFLDAVQRGRVERVMFQRTGESLVALSDDGRRAFVTVRA